MTFLAISTMAKAQSCNQGSVQCCNSVVSASTPAASTLLAAFGIVVQDVNVSVGINYEHLLSSIQRLLRSFKVVR